MHKLVCRLYLVSGVTEYRHNIWVFWLHRLAFIALHSFGKILSFALVKYENDLITLLQIQSSCTTT